MIGADGIRDDIDEMIGFLNELLLLDGDAVNALVSIRVACNQALTDHPTVQVGDAHYFDPTTEGWVVGLLGILNGWMGKYNSGPKMGYGAISARIDDQGIVTSFFRTNNTDPLLPGETTWRTP